jgi:hypothetical protein
MVNKNKTTELSFRTVKFSHLYYFEREEGKPNITTTSGPGVHTYEKNKNPRRHP